MDLTRFSVPPLHKVTRSLAAVAMGREPPELVITGARTSLGRGEENDIMVSDLKASRKHAEFTSSPTG